MQSPSQSFASRRHFLAGLLILCMIVTTILSAGLGRYAGIDLIWVAGFAGWIAGILLIRDASLVLKIQVGAILGVGLGLLVFAASQSLRIDYHAVVTSNSGLLTMIAAVGFLKLVVLPDKPDSSALPVGRSAYLQTLVGLNISSSVINVSAPIIIADRIHQVRALDLFTAQSLVRVFCGVSSWSPFFGAMAAVLTYAAGAELLWIIVIGFPFTMVGLVVVLLEARVRYAEKIDRFVGYPMHFKALKIPFVLILSVIIASLLFPDASVLIVISVSALLITIATLLSRRGTYGAWITLREYVVSGLPRMVNELVLFLVAGVLASGIAVLIHNGALSNPFTQFDSQTATQLLGVICLFAAVGIHPIIMISGLSPMILSLNPNPNLLAATYLFAWHLGTCSSPLSGTNLVFQGRYNIPGWKIAFSNWPYTLLMFVVASAWLPIVETILND